MKKKIGVAKYQQPLNSFYVIIRSKAQLKIKCFSIISMNLNPDAQLEIQNFMFYHPTIEWSTNLYKNGHPFHSKKSLAALFIDECGNGCKFLCFRGCDPLK